MTDLQEKAMRMALERLESHEYWMDEEAIKALRTALAEPEQRGYCTCGNPEALGMVHFRTRPCIHYTEHEPDEFCTATTEELMKTLGCSDEKAKEIHDKVEALAQPEQYDQTALELCEKCGWKAIIPGEGCLICTTPVSIEKQEPIGYVTDSGASAYFLKGVDLDDDTPLYAAPPHYWGNVTSAELVEELRRRDMLMVPVKEQEPEAWINNDQEIFFDEGKARCYSMGWVKPLYTAPPSIEAAVLAEREACAKIVDEWNTAITDKISAEIRARGEK